MGVRWRRAHPQLCVLLRLQEYIITCLDSLSSFIALRHTQAHLRTHNQALKVRRRLKALLRREPEAVLIQRLLPDLRRPRQTHLDRVVLSDDHAAYRLRYVLFLHRLVRVARHFAQSVDVARRLLEQQSLADHIAQVRRLADYVRVVDAAQAARCPRALLGGWLGRLDTQAADGLDALGVVVELVSRRVGVDVAEAGHALEGGLERVVAVDGGAAVDAATALAEVELALD